MASETEIDLAFLLAQSKRTLTKIGSLKDDMAVLIATVQRTDGTMTGMINEMKAVHSRHCRLERRVADLDSSAT